ncbi:hypothetical protein HID58_089172 [Brassica napus]|uniref:Uncharacterized protein n=1 Tax=Brassica napus TaxID=3708 RepID=A0ABQ7XY92_BRANA|nr:telomere repeat-binding protein 4 [Brassica napus]XP_048625164.1 telomere repeat-binding protein 4 [Brassica napus]KAH0860911.1 hypothetical protein HID58_089172 [Brassica napus]
MHQREMVVNSDFDFSSFPKAPRSIRRKVPSSQRRDDVDCGMMRAIDLLASVAEKLREEGETSSNSTNAFEEGYYNQNHLAGKIKQEHQAHLASSKSPRKRIVNLDPPLGCGNKKEDCEFHVESGGLTEETCVVNNVDAGLEDGGLISLKDPSPEPVHLDGVPNEYRNRSKLVCRDDDENYCKCYKCKDKCNKSYRPPLTWAGHRRAVHRSQCFEGTKTDGCLYRKRKLGNGYNPRKHETVHKKRRLSDKGLVVNSDGGGLTSESVTNSTEKRESENGVLSDAIGLPSEDSRVKFSIKSLRIPELFIEVPETATVGSLKMTVMEAVSALLDDGISIGVLVQGKKVRDDNNTLSQTGLSCRENLGNLGFTLEPGPEKLRVPLSSENPVMSKPTDSTKLSERSAANCVENNNQELVPYQMDISADEKQPSSDSRALVPVSALEPEALAIVPFKEKPKRTTELSQRRTRRPFSVTEVEALVHAVEELGTGRWRDVKLRSFDDASHRTYVDLKDKWKTLVHTASISPQQRRGEPVPQELLDRVLAAHRYWTQHPLKQNGKHQAAATMVTESAPSM